MRPCRPDFDPNEPDEALDRHLADFLRREADRRVLGRRPEEAVVTAILGHRPHGRDATLGALAVAVLLVLALAGSLYFGSSVAPVLAPSSSPATPPTPVASHPAKLLPTAAPPPAPDLAWAKVDLAGTFPGGLWAVQGTSYLLSTDAGSSWRQTPLPAAPLQGAQAVAVLDATHAWYVAAGPGSTPITGAPSDVLHLVVYRTSDGGRTWKVSAIPGNYPETSQSLVFVDGDHGYLLCSAERFSSGTSTVLATSDGGATWRVVGTSPWLGSMLAGSDPTTLWAGAQPEAGPVSHPLLAVSRDGGRTWQDVALPGLGQPGGALSGPPEFSSASTGVVAAGSLLFRTTDGGRTWTRLADLPSQASTAPALLDATHWLAPTVNPSGLASTTDGGASWRHLITSGLSGVANQGWIVWIGASDASHVAALEPIGNDYPGGTALYLSADGGRNWRPADVVGVATDPVAPSVGSCPSAPLDFDPRATENAIAAARTAVPLLYRGVDTSGYQVRAAAPAAASSVAGWGAIAGSLCGSLTRSRTYVVELYFPAMEPSASLSQGQLFVSRSAAGWQVWYQYH
jgi:photosystem II stability/assembly factor-like uncharacterized protein